MKILKRRLIFMKIAKQSNQNNKLVIVYIVNYLL